MDPLSGINAYTSLYGIGTNAAITPSNGLLASGLGLSTPGLFGGSSTFAAISGAGQLLSAAVTFQNQLQTLQPGTATSGGGHNFGTDFASLAAETQSFVNTFNALQGTISGINGTNNLTTGGVAGASGLVQLLNTQAQASYANGNSTLTKLSQLGIEFQPSQIPGGSGKLVLDLNTLKSAFTSNATGAFSLLSSAATSLSNVAGNFISQSGSQYASLNALLPSSLGASLFANSLSPQAQNSNNLFSLLTSPSWTGGTNWQQVFGALNQYTMVSSLFG